MLGLPIYLWVVGRAEFQIDASDFEEMLLEVAGKNWIPI
jgi:hypothetical protein